MVRPLAYLLLAFVAGSVPFALVLGHLRGRDLRQLGSRNPGATNAFRVLGPAWGIAALAGDIGKGWLAVGLLPAWVGLDRAAAGSLWPLGGALAAVLGHIFSPLAGFRGGKGVATAVGGFVGLAPWAALVASGAFVVAVSVTRYVSVGSLALAVAFPLAAFFIGPPAPLRLGVVALGVVLALLIAWRHRVNWRRIAAGREGRLTWPR